MCCPEFPRLITAPETAPRFREERRYEPKAQTPGARARAKAHPFRQHLPREELAPSKEELAKAALSEERSVIKPEPAAEIDAAFNVEPLIRSKAAAGSAADVFGAVTPEPVANVEPVVSAANVEPDVEFFAPAAEAGPGRFAGRGRQIRPK